MLKLKRSKKFDFLSDKFYLNSLKTRMHLSAVIVFLKRAASVENELQKNRAFTARCIES